MPTASSLARRRFVVTGQVQGVGFRPFVYRIAVERDLAGFVKNSPEGVVIEVTGPESVTESFRSALVNEVPPLARIVSLDDRIFEADAMPDDGFRILKSDTGEGHAVLISPDTATCADCLAEMNDPQDRRFLYPFTNCTNCGPRYTITRSIPYDRATTSMACFPLCEACAAEYEDPLNRRFHAQPNACPVCGPRIWLQDADGGSVCQGMDALRELARRLVAGEIAAIKGLGGFHLACDATNDTAVQLLRERKLRPHKPLAVMVPDIDAAAVYVHIDDDAKTVLTGAVRPIALLPRSKPRPESAPLAASIATDTDLVGVMLPYTPLHHVLFRFLKESGAGAFPALVMTSGNMSDEPIALGNREALDRLAHIADCFLLHDRDILIRTDDSVVMPLRPEDAAGQPEAASKHGPPLLYFRRARGYTPSPVDIQPLEHGAPVVLGAGPELKNTICLTKGAQAFLSQHIGDLENLETLGFFREITTHLQSILQVAPELVVHDLHPNFLATRWALEESGLPTMALQHHVAHIHAVLAEHRFRGAALGLALDGTGLGEDGTLWGGEAIFVDTGALAHERVAHFAPILLPGGDAAVKEPWRIAQSCLHALGITKPGTRPWPWLDEFGAMSSMLPQMLEKKINAPVTTSCGRLFDGVAAMLGIANTASYEGQAAIRLEGIQDSSETAAYACPMREDGALDTLALFIQVHADWEVGVPAGVISRRFHLGLIQGLAAWAAHHAQRLGVSNVALSGGVFQNRTIALGLPPALAARGLTPLRHGFVPPNDGCIALGQAAWGRLMLAKG
ncbi:carbamoyltransferase HypF [Oceanidesulfovibrio indonesiensis]|uniref:Carbamoyltransferase n=1 Tax=Oceanidesulfovibrio indonesiensis TaxID=54767 RepID=A0A7M3ME96_9BACT|nr:carbamoyltransferase HypF [Oceanidesulfovibrio indonesiensis]TVM17121.1 carbamoyltransferase HypF [Oceanidesulfovibrio indonesiensis]